MARGGIPHHKWARARAWRPLSATVRGTSRGSLRGLASRDCGKTPPPCPSVPRRGQRRMTQREPHRQQRI